MISLSGCPALSTKSYFTYGSSFISGGFYLYLGKLSAYSYPWKITVSTQSKALALANHNGSGSNIACTASADGLTNSCRCLFTTVDQGCKIYVALSDMSKSGFSVGFTYSP